MKVLVVRITALLLILLVTVVSAGMAQDTGPITPDNSDSLNNKQTATSDKITTPTTPKDSLEKVLAEDYLLGEKLFEEGKIDRAIVQFERVEKESPNYKEVRQKLVEAYKFSGIEKYNQNRQDEAIAIWKKAARLDPRNEEIAQFIERGESEILKLGALSPESKQDIPADTNKVKPSGSEDLLNTSKNKTAPQKPTVDYAGQIRTLSDSIEMLGKAVEELSVKVSSIATADTADKLVFTGFVDVSEYNNHNLNRGTFKLEEMELDLVKELSDKVSFRTDIEFITDSLDAFKADIEQGFIICHFGSQSRWQANFGKFNAPIGLEPCDASEMYLYSDGLISEYGIPGNMTGLIFARRFSSSFTWSIFAVNGWDINTDNNKDKTFGTDFNVEPMKQLTCHLSALSGPERDNDNSSRRSVFDFNFTFQPSDILFLEGEVNYGLETEALDNNTQADWFGILLMSRCGLVDKVWLSLRFDLFEDHEGLRTGYVQNRKTLSIAPSFMPLKNLRGLVECRYDFSDRMTFVKANGEDSDKQITTAFELTYSF